MGIRTQVADRTVGGWPCRPSRTSPRGTNLRPPRGLGPQHFPSLHRVTGFKAQAPPRVGVAPSSLPGTEEGPLERALSREQVPQPLRALAGQMCMNWTSDVLRVGAVLRGPIRSQRGLCPKGEELLHPLQGDVHSTSMGGTAHCMSSPRRLQLTLLSRKSVIREERR